MIDLTWRLLEVDSIPIFTTLPRFLQMWLSAMGALEMNGRWGVVLLGWGLWVCQEKQVSKSVLRWLVYHLPQNARCFLHEFLFEQEWFVVANSLYSRWSIWMVIPDIRHCKFRAPGLSFTETKHHHASCFPKAHKSIYSIPLLLAGDLHAFAAQFYSLPLAFLLSFLVVDEVWMFLMPVESLISFVNSWMERHSLPKVPTGGGRKVFWADKNCSNTEMA